MTDEPEERVRTEADEPTSPAETGETGESAESVEIGESAESVEIGESAETDEPSESIETDETESRWTYVRDSRWSVAAPAALSLVSLGLLYASPLLLGAAVIPLAYVVYGSLSAVPTDASVRVERSFDDQSPTPGERTTVSVTVTNDSEATMPDVRVVDGVPGELAVDDGSPRRSLSLRPGESVTYTYGVLARRGEYAFDDPLIRLRSLSGSAVLTESVTVSGAERLSCLTPLSDATSDASALRRAGTHPTDSGGPGTEFYSTREYQPGDPKNRIHWRRFAQTGELTTVAYREERAVTTVLVVDARPVGRVSPRAGVPTGAALSGYAGERLYDALTGGGVVTSVTAVGVETEDLAVPVQSGGFPWVAGDADGATTLARALFEAIHDAADGKYRDAAADNVNDGRGTGPPPAVATEMTAAPDGSADGETKPPNPAAETATSAADAEADTSDTDAGTAAPDGGSTPAHHLLSQLPSDAEVVLVTPLLDDWAVSVGRTLRTQSYPVTVVSPDVAGTGSAGGTVADIERRARLRALERVGVTTADWTPGDSLEAALADSVTHLIGRNQ